MYLTNIASNPIASKITPTDSAINPLASSIANLTDTDPVDSPESVSGILDDKGSFSDIFSQSIRNAIDTSWDDKTSAVELLSGKSDDMSGLLLDAEKAQIALSLTLQMRNKVMDAYSEITRMQV